MGGLGWACDGSSAPGRILPLLPLPDPALLTATYSCPEHRCPPPYMSASDRRRVGLKVVRLPSPPAGIRLVVPRSGNAECISDASHMHCCHRHANVGLFTGAGSPSEDWRYGRAMHRMYVRAVHRCGAKSLDGDFGSWSRLCVCFYYLVSEFWHWEWTFSA